MKVIAKCCSCQRLVVFDSAVPLPIRAYVGECEECAAELDGTGQHPVRLTGDYWQRIDTTAGALLADVQVGVA
jgi:hypothetical protein